MFSSFLYSKNQVSGKSEGKKKPLHIQRRILVCYSTDDNIEQKRKTLLHKGFGHSRGRN